MQAFTKTDRQIDVRENKKFSPIPANSFAEALYEVCQRFVTHVEKMEVIAKAQMEQEAKSVSDICK